MKMAQCSCLLALALFAATLTCVSACLGAPYLYVSFHGGSGEINNVAKYSRDGCSLGSVLNPSSSYSPAELRSLLVLSDGTLAVTNADNSNDDYAIVLFGQCNNDTVGTRNFISQFVTTSTSSGMDHPYGLAVNPLTGDLYVSNQHDDTVLRFYGPSSPNAGQPIPSPPSIPDPQYPGLFMQLDTSSQGVRSVAFNCDSTTPLLFVAQEDDDLVYVVDVTSGNTVNNISVSTPISLYTDCTSNTLFIGSHDSNTPQVVAVDATSYLTISTYSNSDLQHPAGMVVWDGVLFVLGHDEEALVSFNIKDGSYNGFIVQGFADNPEQLTLSSC